jgi:hypothetical protein
MAQPFPPQQECPGKDEGDGELPVEKLQEGLRLKYVSRDEAATRLAEAADELWVVDVASARSMSGVVPSAILLMRKGRHA